jgi:hypothetical protein
MPVRHWHEWPDLQALDESSPELAPARSGQVEERVVAQTTRVSLAALGIFNYSLREPFSRSFCLAACQIYSGFLEGPPSLVVCGRQYDDGFRIKASITVHGVLIPIHDTPCAKSAPATEYSKLSTADGAMSVGIPTQATLTFGFRRHRRRPGRSAGSKACYLFFCTTASRRSTACS